MQSRLVTEYRKLYETMLFDNVIPFWMKHSQDREYGGYLHMLDRDGSVYSTDKYAWPHGRQVWVFSTLCDEVERRQEWLDMAKLGWDFIVKHFIGPEGRVWYSLTREGKPLSIPRRIFSETFIIMAAARYAKVTGDAEAARIAREMFRNVVEWSKTPMAGSQKGIPGVRPMITMAIPMIMMNVAREMMIIEGETQELLDYSKECIDTFLDKTRPPGA
jgi:N-acylglucosamine 2-epimerase